MLKINPWFRDQVTQLLRTQASTHWLEFSKRVNRPPATIKESIERTVHSDKEAIKLRAVWALERHDFVYQIEDELIRSIKLLRNMDWWDQQDFEGYTEHRLNVAGLARALAEAVAISQSVDEPTEELPDNDTPMEQPSDETRANVGRIISEQLRKFSDQDA